MEARCRNDIILFCNLFGWLVEPRGRADQPNEVPFITYAFQDRALLTIKEAVDEQHDLFIEKSRDMGATWMCLYVALHRWLFYPGTSCMLVSRKRDLVYDRRDPDALFSKLEFAIKRLPDWLIREDQYSYTECNLTNLLNRAVIDGESSTGNAGRGGRRTWVAFDEFAAFDQEQPGAGRRARLATADNTQCRVVNTTPLGQANEAFRWRTETDIPILRLHWTEHPVKARGLYYNEDGEPRSPWWEAELKRRGSRKAMAQEVDIDWAAAGGLFFDPMFLQDYADEHGQAARHAGEVHVRLRDGIVEGLEWLPGHGYGHLQTWCELPGGEPDHRHNYVIGADIGLGNGASNSVAAVFDVSTREQVAEYANPNVSPEEFGRLLVALGHWFRGPQRSAYLIWENNGAGITTGNEIVHGQGYRNVYYRRHEEKEDRKTTTEPGWHSTPKLKTLLISRLRSALSLAELIVRSRDGINEAKRYIEDDRGVPCSGKIADQKTGAREAHGDRVVAYACANHGLGLVHKVKPAEAPPPPWSLAWREKQFAQPVSVDSW